MNAFEAAKILYRHGSTEDARIMLQYLWEAPDRRADQEFDIFCALMELWAFEKPKALAVFLESIIQSETELLAFWGRRSISERAVMFDWYGQLALSFGDKETAFESLSRAASIGRDTPLLWRQLGMIYVELGDLDLGLRYIRRSLQLFRQLDFDILSGRDNALGAFTGKHPLNTTHTLEDYLELLLSTTRLAKGLKNLKAVRELVVEMIHQFTGEPRLMKIRLLLERSIVEGSTGARSERQITVQPTTQHQLPVNQSAPAAAAARAYGANPLASGSLK